MREETSKASFAFLVVTITTWVHALNRFMFSLEIRIIHLAKRWYLIDLIDGQLFVTFSLKEVCLRSPSKVDYNTFLKSFKPVLRNFEREKLGPLFWHSYKQGTMQKWPKDVDDTLQRMYSILHERSNWRREHHLTHVPRIPIAFLFSSVWIRKASTIMCQLRYSENSFKFQFEIKIQKNSVIKIWDVRRFLQGEISKNENRLEFSIRGNRTQFVTSPATCEH